MKKVFVLIIIFLCVCPTFAVCADEGEISLDTIYEGLPDEIVKYTQNDFDIELIIGDVLKNGISFSIKTFATVITLCLITVYLNSLCPNTKGNSYILGFISTYGCAVTVYSLIYSQIATLTTYAQRLSELMGGFLIFSNSVFLFCGYVTTAATTTAWLQLIMNLVKSGVNSYLIVLLKLLCGISLADQTICKGRLSSFAALIKSTFLWVSSIIITIVSTVMTVQTSISKISDTASVQSIKFAATQAFPIVGGLVSESVRNVAGTANSAKTAGGAIVLVLIAIIALFPLSSLLGIKIGLYLAQTGCDFLGCKDITEIITKAFSLINFMLAVVGILASVFAISSISFMLQSISLVS